MFLPACNLARRGDHRNPSGLNVFGSKVIQHNTCERYACWLPLLGPQWPLKGGIIFDKSRNFLFPSCHKRKEEERNSLVKFNNGWVVTLGTQISISSLWPVAQKYSDLISESLPNLWSPWISFGHFPYLFPVRLIKLYKWKKNSPNLKSYWNLLNSALL